MAHEQGICCGYNYRYPRSDTFVERHIFRWVGFKFHMATVKVSFQVLFTSLMWPDHLHANTLRY